MALKYIYNKHSETEYQIFNTDNESVIATCVNIENTFLVVYALNQLEISKVKAEIPSIKNQQAN